MISLDVYFDLTLSHTPYAHNMAHLQDLLSLAKLYLSIYEELSKNPYEQSHYQPILRDALTHIKEREVITLENTYLPVLDICTSFRLSLFEYLCLIFAISTELDESLCKSYINFTGYPHPTYHLIMCLYGITEDIDSSIFNSANLETSPLQYLFYPNLKELPTLMHEPLCIRKNIMLYISENYSIADETCTFFPHTSNTDFAPLYETELHTISKLIASPNASQNQKLIILSGNADIGKKTLVKKICMQTQINCLFIDLCMLQELEAQNLTIYLKDLCFKLLMSHSTLCLWQSDLFPMEKNKVELLYRQILLETFKFTTTGFICLKEPLIIKLPHIHAYQYDLNTETLNERMHIWNYANTHYPLSVDLKSCASKYKLPIGKLIYILEDIQDEVITESLLSKHLLVHSKIIPHAYNVQNHFTFKDLILDEHTLGVLSQISSYVKHRYTIFEEWGFNEKLAYGKGLNILFYGAPGTGKTMCASVLANEWGLELQKVDLSQIMDKYIGETEKKLDEIFTSAKQNNCVLFFDEADSLFSKRTEISSSHDKYANLEVSHLLQKMELYDGIIILATNLVQNFDDAFKRRINFMVRFNLPTPDIRKKLWMNAFPSKAPLDENIDFDILAEKYDLSPSAIKSTSLFAAFLASSAQTSIDMFTILDAIKYEYEKNNRLFPI